MNRSGKMTIVGTGSFAPGKPVTNAALSRVMDTDDAWIRQRTGIAQRHFADDGQGCSDLGVEASKAAIQAANLKVHDIDYIIFATMTPDYIIPGSGGLLGSKLGITGVPALDIRQQCAAVPFGLQVAHGLIETGTAKSILFVGAEAHAGFMPWEDWDLLLATGDDAEIAKKVNPTARALATRHRGLTVLFGDGAGAMVLQKSDRDHAGYIDSLIKSDGGLAEYMYLPAFGFRHRPFFNQAMIDREEHVPRMNGKDLFKHAVTQLPKVVRELLNRHTLTTSDIDWFVAHQANDRINQTVTEALKVDPNKVPSNIAKYGNTSGATIPILMDEMIRDGRAKKGDLICFLALGAGLHWGATLMRL